MLFYQTFRFTKEALNNACKTCSSLVFDTEYPRSTDMPLAACWPAKVAFAETCMCPHLRFFSVSHTAKATELLHCWKGHKRQQKLHLNNNKEISKGQRKKKLTKSLLPETLWMEKSPFPIIRKELLQMCNTSFFLHPSVSFCSLLPSCFIFVSIFFFHFLSLSLTLSFPS